VHMKERSFIFPIKVEPARRPDIKQLELYQSLDEGRTWAQIAVVSPEKDGVTVNALTDGMYWYSLQSVFKDNSRDPSDVLKAPPSQKILIDTLPPNLKIVSTERHDDDLMVSWQIQEDHPDLSTLKLEYRPADANQWY